VPSIPRLKRHSDLKPTQVLYQPSLEAFRFLPEGPYPIGNGKFSWVAIQHGPSATHGSINVFDLATGQNESHPLPGRPGFAFPTDKGNFVVGCERSIGLFSPSDKGWRPFVDGIDSDCSGTIVNDGVTWDGNLIFGTKDLEFKTKKAGLYFWRASDGKLFRLRADQICSNGKCVLPIDANHIELLDIDTPTKKVVAYVINTELGKIESERVVVDLANDIAFPDGMTMSLDGKSVIISMYNPNPAPFGRTVQFSIATGKEEHTWQTIGSPQATCPQLIYWNDRVWMVITTAVEHMSSERRKDSPEAGSLFMAETDFAFDKIAYERLTPLFRE
jgi:sugar lactone lactonase YvrE